MREELRKLYVSGNDIFGYPQMYKGISLYPIKIKDTDMQNLFYQIFSHPKTYIPNVDILKSSYLKFYMYVVGPNLDYSSERIVNDFLKVMKYICKTDDIVVGYKEIPNAVGLDSVRLLVKIKDIEISEEEFDDIREIVLEQNGLSIEYIESYNPEMEVHLSFMNRNSSNITMQDEIFTFCAIMRMGLKDVEDYTIFQFKNQMEKLLVLKEFDLYKPLLVSGQITLKGGEVKHYFYHSVKAGRYDSIIISTDDFMKQNEGVFD
jgi:hypothetical protein